MELSLTNQVKRSGPSVQAICKKDAGPAAAPKKEQERSDRVSISKEAVARLEEHNRRIMEHIRQEAEKRALEETEDSSGGDPCLDALGESMKTMERCHKIAARIMRGDKVPPQDEQYLMKNDPTGYKLAMAARKPKKKPKKWKSVLNGEEDKNRVSKEDAASRETEAAPLEEEASGESGGADEE